MSTYLALLRGINVSGHKKIRMEDLRTYLGELGFERLQTYIQSGNIVFESGETRPEALEAQISDKIREKYGFEVPVMVKDVKEWSWIASQNPFVIVREEDIRYLHLTFLSAVPDPALIALVKDQDYGADEFVPLEKAIYLFCPEGYGRTKLSNNFFEKKLKLRATTRNWKTVLRLLEMAGGY